MQERLEGFPLNIRVLQEYIAFSRVLNFSVAAQQLYLSQSTLSTHMQKLEEDLGVRLINHGAKPTLTPSGKLFVQYSGKIVKMFLEAVDEVRRFESSALSIVVEEPQSAGSLFNATIRTFDYFANELPQAEINLHPIMGSTPLAALKSRAVEVVKLIDHRDPESSEFLEYAKEQGISTLPISEESPVAWMQGDNPLAKKKSLTVEDLAETTILVPADVRYDDWRALIRLWFERRNLRAGFHMQVTETLMEFYMTKPGDKVFVLPESMEAGKNLLAARNLVARRINTADCRYFVSLAWLTANQNPLLPFYLNEMDAQLHGKKNQP